MERSLGDHAASDLAFASQANKLPVSLREKIRYLCITIYSFAVVGFLHERLMSGQDPGNFLAAIKLGLDTTKVRPHVPGYPLFVLLWQGLASVGISPESAIYFTNAIWISIGLCALYKLAQKFANARVAWIATLFAALNPLILFYGSTGELYVYDLAFSSGFILWASSTKRDHLKWVWLAFGIAGGFRLSSIMFLYPAMLTASWLRKEKMTSIAAHHLIGAIGILLWLLPFVMHHGGIGSLAPMITDSAALPSTVLQSSATYLSSFVWVTHLTLPLLLLLPTRSMKLQRDHLVLLLVWFIPPTLFFLFKFYTKGYIVLTLPVIAIMVALVIDSFAERTRQIAAATVLAAGLGFFFLVPLLPPAIPLERSTAIGDRVKTAGLRTLSWFATSNAHLRARESMMKEAKDLLEAYVPQNGVVLASSAMPVWVHPRTLQFHVPDRVILMPEGQRVARLFAYDMTREMELIDALADTSYFMCPTELALLTPAINALPLAGRTATLSLYKATAGQLATLNDTQ